MAVIKVDKANGFIKDAVVLDLGDIGRQAARIRMAAEEKAADIVTNAERKAKQLLEEAAKGGFEEGKEAGLQAGRDEGRRAGRAEALEEAREQLAQLQAAWSDVATQWDAQTKGMAVEARQVVIEFALKLAERLVHRVIEVDPSVVVDQVAGALALVLRPMDVAVRVNPSELSIISEALPQLMAEFDHLEHIHLTEDPQVSPGGCVVSYGQGQIDATIEKQIQRVVDLILPADTDAETQSVPLLDQVQDPGGEQDEYTDDGQDVYPDTDPR